MSESFSHVYNFEQIVSNSFGLVRKVLNFALPPEPILKTVFTALVVIKSFMQLFLRIENEGASGGDRLVQRLTSEHDEASIVLKDFELQCLLFRLRRREHGTVSSGESF